MKTPNSITTRLGICFALAATLWDAPPVHATTLTVTNTDDNGIGAFGVNPPLLSIARSGGNVLVSWPAYDTGYTLEAKTDLNPSINWSDVPGTPAIVAGQFTVTNSATTGIKFYRLRSP